MKIDQLIRYRASSTSTTATKMQFKIGIVIGSSKRAGKVRVSRWQHNSIKHWSSPLLVAETQLEPIDDMIVNMPLTEAKHLMSVVFERGYLKRAMEHANGMVAEAARMSGLDRTNFRRLLQRHGLR